MRGAGLECDVKCPAFWIVAFSFGVTQRFDFGVRQTSAMMPTFTNHFAAFDKDCADHRIGRGRAVTALREF